MLFFFISALGPLPLQSRPMDPHSGSRPVKALLLPGKFLFGILITWFMYKVVHN